MIIGTKHQKHRCISKICVQTLMFSPPLPHFAHQHSAAPPSFFFFLFKNLSGFPLTTVGALARWMEQLLAEAAALLSFAPAREHFPNVTASRKVAVAALPSVARKILRGAALSPSCLFSDPTAHQNKSILDFPLPCEFRSSPFNLPQAKAATHPDCCVLTCSLESFISVCGGKPSYFLGENTGHHSSILCCVAAIGGNALLQHVKQPDFSSKQSKVCKNNS